MRALLYVAESQNENANKQKMEIMTLWAEVHDVQLVGVIYELNDEQKLGEKGKVAISTLLHELEVDALIVMSANDLSPVKPEICECVQIIHSMGAEVIAIQGDLPDCNECKSEPKQVINHCTVTIFEE